MTAPKSTEVPWRNIVGAGLCLLVAIVYSLTLCRFAYPVASAPLIVAYLGLDPLEGLQQPLWGCLLRIFSHLPVGTLAFRCNLLSVPQAVLSVWLMFRLVSSIPYYHSAEEEIPDRSRHFAQIVSGVVAALFLAFSPPFWFVATRAHPGALQVLFLLACVSLLLAAKRNPEKSVKKYFAFAFVYGLATIDFPTFYLLVPLFGMFLLYQLLVTSQLTWRNVLSICGFGLLGYSFVLPMLLRFMQSNSYQWQEFSGFGNLLWLYVKSQGIVLLKSTPKVGWLLVALFSILPWFAVIFLPRSLAKKPEGRVGAYFLLVLLYASGVLILFDLHLAPFNLLGLRPLLITPYVFVACWFGYLTGFWVYVLRRHSRRRKNPPGVVRQVTARMMLPAAVAGIAVAATLNYPTISPRQAAPIAAMAKAVVDDLQGRTWLISNGELDANLALAAHEQGIPLKLVSVRRMSSAPYRKYLASLFESPRLQAMADIGLNPLIGEWSREDPNWDKIVAVLSQPDLWYATGYTPDPSSTLYLGRALEDDSQAAQAWEEPVVWQEILTLLEAADQPPDILTNYLKWVRNHFGKLANNVGVSLADRHNPADADKAFVTARRIDKDNISAMLNRYSLAYEEDAPNQDVILAELEAFADEERAKIPIWSLSYSYGYVRNADSFMRRGWSWALSGKPAVAIRELERAVASGVPEEGVQLALAALYYQEGREQESEQRYYDFLKNNPGDLRALMALTRIAMRRGDYDTAQSNLARMLDEGAPPNLVRVELAAVEILRGNPEQAKQLLEKILEMDSTNERALGMLAMLASQEGSKNSLAEIVGRLRAIPDPSPNGLMTLSILSEASGDLETARADLERLIDKRPNHALALERLLGLDVREGRMDLAEKHVRSLLSLDPGNAQGNLVLGSIQYSQGELVLAEASFRASIGTKPAAESLNSLAWILYLRGALEEALDLSQKALDLNPRHGVAWDTKGMALTALDRLDEAEQALLAAMDFAPQDPRINFHLAELYVKQGKTQQAVRILKTLESRGGELPTDLFNKVTKLLNDLKESS